jgi:hypothetical protein
MSQAKNSTAMVPASSHHLLDRETPGLPDMYAQDNGRTGVYTAESIVGQKNWMPAGPGRLASPEDANADFSREPPAVISARAADEIPGVFPVQGVLIYERPDFPTISNFQYVRAACDVLGALGRNDQDEQPGVASGNNFEHQCPSSPNFILGFVVEWSQQRDTSAAIPLIVTTAGFKGASDQVVDRKFTVRVGHDHNTGIFGFLFASRMSANDSCGYAVQNTAMATAGFGGMNRAIVQLAKIVPYTDVDVSDDDSGKYKNQFIPGANLPSTSAAPKVTVTVPSATGFSCSIRPITAASMWLAVTRERLGIDAPRGSGRV